MNYAESLMYVFQTHRYRVIFAMLLVVSTALLAVTSDIAIPSTLELNPIAEPGRIAVVAVIAVLMALNLTLAIYRVGMQESIGRSSPFLGGVAALFTSTCPVCQPVWLVWLGMGSATAFLADFGLYIGLASIAFLLLSLHYSLQSVSGKCEVKSHGKND